MLAERSMIAERRGPSAVPSSKQAGIPQGIILAIAGFLPIMAILSLAPAVPTMLAHFKDIPYATILVPLTVTAPGLMMALLSPIAGWVADRYGRRRPLLLATFLYGFFGTAPFVLDNLSLVFITRLGVGVTEMFIMVNVNALIADYYSINRRRTWLTVQGMVGPLLGIVSLAVAGYLASIGWNYVFLIYLSPFLVFAAMAIWCFEPQVAVEIAGDESPQVRFPARTVATFCIVTLGTSIVYYVYVVQAGLAYGAIGITSSARVGILLGIASIGVPAGALLFNILSRRISGESIVACALMLLGVGTAAVGIARSEAFMLAGALVQEVGAGITVTGLLFWVSRLLLPEHRGRGFGFWTTAFFLGQFVSPLVFGLVSQLSGSVLNSFLVLGLVGVAGAAIIIALKGTMPRSLEVSSG